MKTDTGPDSNSVAEMAKARMVIGDATGASAIVEWYTVTMRDPRTNYQIGTSTTPRNRI